MIRFIGLDFLAQDALITAFIMLVIAAFIAGWISDSIMGGAGYGIFGNAVLTLVGALAGLAAWTQFVGPMLPRQMPWVGASAGGGALATLLFFALLKQAMR